MPESAHIPQPSSFRRALEPYPAISRAFSPYAGEQKCPYEALAVLRAAAPLYYCGPLDMWFCTSQEQIVSVLRRADVSSELRTDDPGFTRSLKALQLYDLWKGSTVGSIVHRILLFRDEPFHAQIRRFLQPLFSPRAVASLESAIRTISHEVLASAFEMDAFDFVDMVAGPIPARVICRVVGLPEAEAGDIRRWGGAIAKLLDPLITPAEFAEAESAFLHAREHIERHIERSTDGDTTTAIGRFQSTDHDISLEDFTANAAFLLAAGQETLKSFIANTTLCLLEHPDQLAVLLDDLTRAPAVVEEGLRYESPIQLVTRTARAQLALGGEGLFAGETVACMLGAGNRDGAGRNAPEAFQVERSEDAANLAFGLGAHHCIGAGLARLEARVVLECLGSHLRTRGLIVEDASWVSSISIRCLERLPVRVVARP
ncbi:MAG TPA: cytochrome P450 [Acidimicrobiales bacterium]|nr:cytochrome P450 [Acidimicrobiales bacterium]